MAVNPFMIKHSILSVIASKIIEVALKEDVNYSQVEITAKDIEPTLLTAGFPFKEIDKWSTMMHLEGYLVIDYKQSGSIIKMTEKGMLAAGTEYYKYEYLKQRREIRLISSNLKTNRTTRRNNIWSPLFAGLAFVFSVLGFIRELVKDKRQQESIEILKQKVSQQGNSLLIQQTQINSLLRVLAPRDTAKVGNTTAIN